MNYIFIVLLLVTFMFIRPFTLKDRPYVDYSEDFKLFLIAEQGGQIIGSIGVKGDEIFIFVKPNFRGQGVGTKLMNKVLKVIKKCKINVPEEFEGFFNKFGFVTVSRENEMVFMKN